LKKKVFTFFVVGALALAGCSSEDAANSGNDSATKTPPPLDKQVATQEEVKEVIENVTYYEEDPAAESKPESAPEAEKVIKKKLKKSKHKVKEDPKDQKYRDFVSSLLASGDELTEEEREALLEYWKYLGAIESKEANEKIKELIEKLKAGKGTKADVEELKGLQPIKPGVELKDKGKGKRKKDSSNDQQDNKQPDSREVKPDRSDVKPDRSEVKPDPSSVKPQPGNNEQNNNEEQNQPGNNEQNNNEEQNQPGDNEQNNNEEQNQPGNNEQNNNEEQNQPGNNEQNNNEEQNQPGNNEQNNNEEQNQPDNNEQNNNEEQNQPGNNEQNNNEEQNQPGNNEQPGNNDDKDDENGSTEKNGYNRHKAQQYAYQWWDKRNNEEFGYYSRVMGGCYDCWYDCTNFISQVVYKGGIKQRTSGSLWYYSDDGPPHSWGVANAFYAHFKDRSKPVDNIWDLKIGDVISFDFDSNNRIDHTAVVTKITNSGIYVTQHTYDKKDSDVTAWFYVPTAKVYAFNMGETENN
jgi:hypothetical protein